MSTKVRRHSKLSILVKDTGQWTKMRESSEKGRGEQIKTETYEYNM